MKFSLSWLRYWVDAELSADALAESLTMAGLEVEESTTAAPFFSQVVVGEIVVLEKHPNADKLKVCQVNVGKEKPLQIVCGAPNAQVGLRVPCALNGAELPNGIKIKTTKMRGVESQGMLCSAKELGISADSSGLMVLPMEAFIGVSLREYLDLDDVLFTIKLTPNRADCLSVLGIAREVKALTGKTLQYPAINEIKPETKAKRPIFLKAPEHCPRYLGRVFQNVNAQAPTPDWIKNRLERSGLRSISALVDITNYVMLELGQPLHAFDNQKITGAIAVRLGKEGETLTLLNDESIDLNGVLTIADEKGALAAAGLMGGKASAISLETTEVFLESAFFTPDILAGKARKFGLTSDAAYRYERGVDFEGCLRAMKRASELIITICGGVAGEVSVAEEKAHLPQRLPITLRHQRLEKILGIPLDGEDVEGILSRLDFSFKTDSKNARYCVNIPSFRFDLTIEEDLIEEVARLYGYEEIPDESPNALVFIPAPPKFSFKDFSKKSLVDRGFFEVINFAFVESNWERDYLGNSSPITLMNPIAAQMSVMRSSLAGGLLDNLSKNLKQKQNRVRIFEVGRVFHKNGEAFLQPWHLAGLVYGTVQPENWGNEKRLVDFFDIKGEVEFLLNAYPLKFEAVKNHPLLHPGRAAQIFLNEKNIGWVGELHPQWVQQNDFPHAPMLFELNADEIPPKTNPVFSPIAKFPRVVRDLAVVLEKSIPLDFVKKSLENALPKLVKDIVLFDVYTGAGIPSNAKSLAFRISLQDEQKTLDETDVENALNSILAVLEKTCSAQRRKWIMATLTKADLAEMLFDTVGLNKREAKDMVEAFFEEMGEALIVGDEVKLSGFGNFKLRDKPQRPGRNPKTGESIPISARRVVTFHPSCKLKAEVEENNRGRTAEI